MSRERNHWGWGWADRFPAKPAREAMGAHAAGLLGFGTQAAEDPVPLEQIALPPSRGQAPAVLADRFSCTPADRVSHTYGKGFRDLVRGFRGDYAGAPDWVARPRTESEVVAILDWAARGGVAVVPFGGGTSVVGGVEGPRDRVDCLVSLDLRGLDRVLDVIGSSQHARIQAGALGPGLEAQLAEHGLTLRHFPQSFEFSTLGGWIATRAGGHFATGYTHIDDLVASTRMVTPAGIMESRRLPGSGAGPSPDRLVLGSEGTLGVITEAWMRVRPRPRWRAKAVAHFVDYDRAVEAVRAISQSGLMPSNCRLLDADEAALNMLPSGGAHLLLLGFESADHPLEAWLQRALAIVDDHGGTCPKGPKYKDAGAREDRGADQAWREAFFQGPYLQNILVSMGMVVDTFETAVPWDGFEALHHAILDGVGETMQRVCGGGRISCRFTHVYPDGPAPYYTFIAPGRPGGRLEQWAAIKAAASDAMMAHGATITHHHAVGRTHRPWAQSQRPDLFTDVLKAAKRRLDPAAVLNPGALFEA